MQQRDQASLLDILKAARLALEFAGGLTRDALEGELGGRVKRLEANIRGRT